MSRPTTADPPQALLRPDEPAPLAVLNTDGPAPLVIACDHAGNRVPAALEGLGLPAGELERHIGWDIGAAAVSGHLARLLRAPAILAPYSRLVIDVNRPLADPTCIPLVSDGTPIPGNAALTEAQREARVTGLYDPYHRALGALLEGKRAAGPLPTLVAIHTFTPRLLARGEPRPWHVGVLWNRDDRLARPLLAALRAEPDGWVVGDNEPYSGQTGPWHTVSTHAEERGLPHVMVEVRQDLVADDAGALAWAARLARLLAPLLAGPP